MIQFEFVTPVAPVFISITEQPPQPVASIKTLPSIIQSLDSLASPNAPPIDEYCLKKLFLINILLLVCQTLHLIWLRIKPIN